MELVFDVTLQANEAIKYLSFCLQDAVVLLISYLYLSRLQTHQYFLRKFEFQFVSI